MRDDDEGTFRDLEIPDVARSAHAAYRAAGGSLAPAEWDGLSLDGQSVFLRLAKFGGGELTMLEGRPYAEVGAKLRDLATRGAWPGEAREGLAWEAVARHLTALIDGDDLADLGALEQSWGPWAAKRHQPELQSV